MKHETGYKSQMSDLAISKELVSIVFVMEDEIPKWYKQNKMEIWLAFVEAKWKQQNYLPASKKNTSRG